jgi:predicted Zn-dependent protease
MPLLSSAIANDIISEGISLGADFVDIFIERTQDEYMVFKNSKADDIQSGTIFGIGIRLIYGKQALYGYTNSIKDRVNEILIDLECDGIEVNVENGEVSLLGEINNEETKAEIEKRVKNVNGVNRVYNELHEKSLPQ